MPCQEVTSAGLTVVCPDLAIPSPEETSPLPTRTSLLPKDTRGGRHDSNVFSLNNWVVQGHLNQPQSTSLSLLVVPGSPLEE